MFEGVETENGEEGMLGRKKFIIKTILIKIQRVRYKFQIENSSLVTGHKSNLSFITYKLSAFRMDLNLNIPMKDFSDSRALANCVSNKLDHDPKVITNYFRSQKFGLGK